MNYPAATQMATLECHGNPFTPLILVGNANWTGVPLHTILAAVDPLSGAQSIIFHCVDGYRVHFSLAEVLQRNNDLLAYRMNGVTLPIEQGYPVRLVLPGNIGTTWAQWVERIEMSTTTPSTSFLALPLHGQIFTPQDGTILLVGTHTISGMAVVGEGREITGVEISTDGGVSWNPARLLSSFVPDVWKLWEFTWEASQGDYVISVRADDDLGNQQGYPNYNISVAVDYDSDGDALPDAADNCPNDYNPDQEDTYPPRKNGIGDACDCEADFNCDGNVDGGDVGAFLLHFGRSTYSNPCSDAIPCDGDFLCDVDVDGGDVEKFLEDFGRGQYDRPCPPCTGGEWCIYDLPPDTHLMGEPWLNKTSPDFHGVSLLNCADCHDLSIRCYECHFGASGSKSPPGWTHGTVPHDYLTDSAPVCTTCHDLNRSYGNGPISCHDCHGL
jgi:DMSO/TMAO reductase YedYZ molybdopterin-dependent catalytic subunit